MVVAAGFPSADDELRLCMLSLGMLALAGLEQLLVRPKRSQRSFESRLKPSSSHVRSVDTWSV